MVKVLFSEGFRKKIKKIKDKQLNEKLVKQILKIKRNPEIGKPMKNKRKNSRELYLKPFRVSYLYFKDQVIFLDYYHKDKQ